MNTLAIVNEALGAWLNQAPLATLSQNNTVVTGAKALAAINRVRGDIDTAVSKIGKRFTSLEELQTLAYVPGMSGVLTFPFNGGANAIAPKRIINIMLLATTPILTLQKLDYEKFLLTYPAYLTTVAKPEAYTAVKDKVFLSCKPSQDFQLQIWYSGELQRLSTSNELYEEQWANHWDSTCVAGVAYYLAGMLGIQDNLKFLGESYKSSLAGSLDREFAPSETRDITIMYPFS